MTEISEVVLRERQSRVRMLSDELMACFHEDATVETSWSQGSAAAFVAGAATRSADSGPILNRVGPPVIRVSGRRGFVELPSTTTRWIPVNGTEAVLVSFMRLLYRVENRGGTWKISSLHAVNEGDTLDPAVSGTSLGIDPDSLSGLRHSYRFLAYTRVLEGIEVSQDLYGIDRPEELTALYDDAAAWLEG
ncbi:nuclear transport factor 2 family protein [Pseudarthrobacter raffinosi]|uniref:nuclear transport factor 2 family protein n=1 Tax=Pseudarthrobacter raffinosi TaxID=2953651 RepID=UPI00208E232A|nr:nuclear transport factor 2 family protein [Pseudarthrobacter sp. MDT3-9]MCO4252132.1 nuclear transport factor 2 family protein [Pseudarthrobacter sp. MDT3-9]